MSKITKSTKQYSCWYRVYPREMGWQSNGQLSSDTLSGLKQKVGRFCKEQRRDATKILFSDIEEVVVVKKLRPAFKPMVAL